MTFTADPIGVRVSNPAGAWPDRPTRFMTGLMNQITFAILAALVGGLFVGMQPPTNAVLARAAGSTVNAALVSFMVGGVFFAALALALHQKPDWAGLKALPAWAWLGGIYGGIYVFAITYGAPRIGVAATLTLAIAAQLAAAVVIDQLGWFAMERRPLDLMRAAGVVMVFLGAFLVRRG